MTHACLELGGVHVRQGAWDRAIPVLERALSLCQTWDIPIFFGGIASRLGLAYVLAGRTGEALPLLAQADQETAEPKLLTYPVPAHWMALVAEAHLRADRADGGRAERTLRLARDRHEPGNEAWILRLLGEMAAHRDPPDLELAEAHYREALALAEGLEMRPLVAHCHLGLGTLYHKIGHYEQAQAELATAADMYRAMEMPFWLAKAEAALAQVTG